MPNKDVLNLNFEQEQMRSNLEVARLLHSSTPTALELKAA